MSDRMLGNIGPRWASSLLKLHRRAKRRNWKETSETQSKEGKINSHNEMIKRRRKRGKT
jgi:hypothetical protein